MQSYYYINKIETGYLDLKSKQKMNKSKMKS